MSSFFVKVGFSANIENGRLFGKVQNTANSDPKMKKIRRNEEFSIIQFFALNRKRTANPNDYIMFFASGTPAASRNYSISRPPTHRRSDLKVPQGRAEVLHHV